MDMDMLFNVLSLFMRGKLFRDLNAVLRLQAVGVVISAFLLVVLKLAGVPLWTAIFVSSVIAGATQPWLFKDLKYA
jgi:hypothetical protein